MFETLPAPLAITVVLPEKSLRLVSTLKTDSAQIEQAAKYDIPYRRNRYISLR